MRKRSLGSALYRYGLASAFLARKLLTARPSSPAIIPQHSFGASSLACATISSMNRCGSGIMALIPLLDLVCLDVYPRRRVKIEPPANVDGLVLQSSQHFRIAALHHHRLVHVVHQLVLTRLFRVPQGAC